MESPLTSWQRRPSERGQTFLIIIVVIAGMLLGVMGMATDYAQVWAHRQMAQGAADAACEAGAADLLLQYQDPTVNTAYPQVNFGWIGATDSSFNCSTNSASPPCRYASLNGYSGSNVTVSFPGSIPGASIPAGFGVIPHPYVRVTITDPVPMSFAKLISSTGTVNISAKAGCGIIAVNSPVPIAVLSPTASPALSVTGSTSILIYGGPSRSIQVNSHAPAALNTSGGRINLSHAGPAYGGADMGVFGGPNTNPGVTLGTGHYLSPSAPLGDPFASVPAVSPAGMPVRAQTGETTLVAHGVNGCPTTMCKQFLPGNYTMGLRVQMETAIFDPGIYYVNGGIDLRSNSNVRPSALNDTTAPYGAVFYLTGCTSACIAVNSNSGSAVVDPFSTTRLACPGGGGYVAPPGVTPATQGNMLMAPCTGPYGTANGQYRGILFFVDRSISAATATWGGGGSFILAGAFYAHHPGTYNDVFNMQGNPGSGSLVLGNIVVDTLLMGGNSSINMQLNPNATYQILKVQLLE